MDGDQLDRICRYLEEQRSAMIELQRTLVPLQAMAPENGGHGEWAKARALRAHLERIPGLQLEERNAPDPRVPEGTRPNLVARLRGRRGDHTVWVMGHTDVVPPGDPAQWDTDPWTLEVRDGRLYGRGTEDNHQGCLAGIFALQTLAHLGIQPDPDIGVLLVADEEVGSRFGAGYLVQQEGLFRDQDLLVIPDAGNVDGTMIDVAEKAAVWTKIRTRGHQCHASRPHQGVNAFRAASHLVAKLEVLRSAFPDEDPVFVPPVSTFEPTKKEANVPNVNTVPGDDVFYLDCRVLPRHDPQEVLTTIRQAADEIEEEFGVTVEVESLRASPPAPATPVDAPVVRELQRAILRVTGREARPMGIGGGTVAAVFRKAGQDAAVWATLGGMAHQPNEYCLLDNLVSDAQVMAVLMAAQVTGT